MLIHQGEERVFDSLALSKTKFLWDKSVGVPDVCVAVIDGPVDQSHPCFDGANLTWLPTLVSSVADSGSASQHGTHVASIIFGQHNSPVHGIAPHCRGLIVPVFTNGREGGLAPCSQIDLARAITQAVGQGANVINISGGQLTTSAESDQLLANAVRLCQENNVLIVAAAGNDGCDCLHVPAALESVLAVGAMDAQGNPIGFSNWGEVYQNQGILALGENILGAIPGGGTATKTGTSFATPIVSGIVALLLSIQRQRGEKLDPHAIRDALLQSALPCNQPKGLDSRRCLAGTLNIPGAYALITKGEITQVSNGKPEGVMLQPSEADNTIAQLQPNEVIEFSLKQPVSQFSGIGVQAAEAKISTSVPTAISIGGNPMMVTSSNTTNASVTASECASCSGGGKIQLVYALGELGYDFGTQARRDSIQQSMNLNRPPLTQELLYYFSGEDVEGNPFRRDPHPWEAQSIIWTLNLDATPIYAIAPSGPFAGVVYDRLREFLSDENVERVSIPGYIGGSVRLMSGEVVPVIIPEVRGMYSWSVAALLDAVIEQSTPEESREELRNRIREVLDRIYYDYRNLGVTPQERALNYAATNAFQLSVAISQATLNDRVLDTIEVVKSPICRADSDCYDVKLRFFDPEHLERSRSVKRFTIDVSDVIPVTIGQMRSWSEA
ncbi:MULTISPECIES: PatA/PatG family cyanobactin maturation protease [unclassified Microcoleus]|uniref:PatA/PatG family cyanobactin maturation protease n=1 Tax=unclassified Microcoleus TaxID=2642155 RepID=UPI002FD6E92A